jgi:hypothetical protein
LSLFSIVAWDKKSPTNLIIFFFLPSTPLRLKRRSCDRLQRIIFQTALSLRFLEVASPNEERLEDDLENLTEEQPHWLDADAIL